MIAVVDYHKGNLMSVERGIEAAGGEALITDDAAAIARADGIVLPGVGAFADASATMIELGQMDAIRERIAVGVPFLGICLGMHLLFEEGVEGAPDEDDEESSHNARGLAVLPGVVVRMPKAAPDGASYKVPHVGWNTVAPPTGSGLSAGLASAGSSATRRFAAQPSASCAALLRSDEGIDGAQTVAPLPADAKPAAPTGLPTGASGACGTRFVNAAPPSGCSPSFGCPIFDGIPAGEYFYFTHSYIAPGGPFAVGETTHSVTFPSAVQYGEACFGVQFHPEKSSDAGAAVLRNFVRIVEGR